MLKILFYCKNVNKIFSGLKHFFTFETMKIKFIAYIILLAIINNSCDSTGLCTEPVTPKIQIGFVNLDILGNEEDINPPDNLIIYGNKDGQDIIGDTDADRYLYPSLTPISDKRIGLTLDVDRDNVIFIFGFNADDINTVVYDTLQISYKRNPEFVSLECGHKTTFSNVLIDYTKNYFSKIELITDQIDNEIEQHIKIYLN